MLHSYASVQVLGLKFISHLMAAAEAAAVVPEKEPTPTACK